MNTTLVPRYGVKQTAAAAGLSVHDWLEQTLRTQLDVGQAFSRMANPKPVRP